MATKIVLKDVHVHLDGEYDFDDSYLTNFEVHVLKMLTGLTVGELESARERKDYDAVVAMALFALMREDKIQTNPRRPWESEEMAALWKAHLGSIATPEDVEVPAGPPSPSANGDAQSDEPAESAITSGESSDASSESQDRNPVSTGDPA